ncbi:MAG TPA: 4'-phosphopantetheinyl transferase superfamily protein [Ktedonobacteraceae bacterium]|nr:4'-phosphopantetheinyl transferase superfamily protein [Ktedonobacteraceae bacterium]
MQDSYIWESASQHTALLKEEVHVWRVSLQQPAEKILQMRQLLSMEERARADRFHFEKDRNHFTVARGSLRSLLGLYLQQPAANLIFQYNEHGKPDLLPRAANGLRFNISHSHELALLAFVLDREIGVDLEYQRPNVEFDQIARHSFSPDEQNRLRPLPPNLKQQAFYRCWSRKEAYIKARGKGLWIALKDFDVSFLADEPVRILANREDNRHWFLYDLPPHPQYAGALAIEGLISSIRSRDWQP